MINNKFNYKELKRKTNKNGTRQYQINETTSVPSVTTILGATKSKESREALAKWRKRVGEDNARQITTEAANVGTIMHKNLEDYINEVEIKNKTNLIYTQAKKMSDTIIENAFPRIDEVYGTEVGLFYTDLYAGTSDCVASWNNKLAILDFKQTNKPKKKEWIDDYFIQGCLYAAAHNEMFDTDIKTFVVLMCSRDCEYQEFIIEGDEFDEWMVKAANRVAEYYKIC